MARHLTITRRGKNKGPPTAEVSNDAVLLWRSDRSSHVKCCDGAGDRLVIEVVDHSNYSNEHYQDGMKAWLRLYNGDRVAWEMPFTDTLDQCVYDEHDPVADRVLTGTCAHTESKTIDFPLVH